MPINSIYIHRLADGSATGWVLAGSPERKIYLDTLTAEGLVDLVRPVVEKLEIEEKFFA